MSRRPNPRPIESEWPRARIAQLRRKVMKKMRKFRNSQEFQRLAAREAEQANADARPRD